MANSTETFTSSQFETLLILSVTSSALSFLGSAFIIICYFTLKGLKGNLAFDLVLYLNLSDLFFAVANFMGNPGRADGYGPKSGLCQLQAFMMTYFSLTSLAWSISIAVTLHLGFLKNRHLHRDQELKRFHLINWSIPILLSILPFTTSSYGDSTGWCGIENKNRTDQAWRFITYYIPFWMGIIYNAVIFIAVYRKMSAHLDSNSNAKDSAVMRRSARVRNRLFYYPLILVIYGLPGTINRAYQTVADPLFELSAVHAWFRSMPGLLNALAYGLGTDEVRFQLRPYLPCCSWSKMDMEGGGAGERTESTSDHDPEEDKKERERDREKEKEEERDESGHPLHEIPPPSVSSPISSSASEV